MRWLLEGGALKRVGLFGRIEIYTLFSISNAYFSTQPQYCLIFSWIELQMLLRCCLIHMSIIILRHFLYLPYLYPCLNLSLFMMYLCDLFFIFIMVNHIIFWIQTHYPANICWPSRRFEDVFKTCLGDVFNTSSA